MNIPVLQLKKGEERRLRSGHLWVYSNEIDTRKTPLADNNHSLVRLHDNAGRFLALASFNPHALICARILTTRPNQLPDQQYFLERIQKALSLRETFFTSPCYRLVFGEGDFLPGLVVDRYQQTFVIQTSTRFMDEQLPVIEAVLRKLFGADIDIQIKNDGKGRQIEQLPAYNSVTATSANSPDIKEKDAGRATSALTVTENGVEFQIPADGQKTGWFYDHRPGRQWVNAIARGKTMLDLFSYMGGWGIQAAAHGATHVTCVDISSQAGEHTLLNAGRLGLRNQVSFKQANVFDWLKQPVDQLFDIVIADPPALIQKKRDFNSGRQAYFQLNEQALQRVSNGGILVSASCSSHLPVEELAKIVEQAAGRLNYRVQQLHQTGAGPDHPVNIAMPETAYLKTLMFRVSRDE